MACILLRALALGLLLPVLASGAPEPTGSSLPPAATKLAWKAACRISKYPCWYLSRPDVVRAPMVGLLGRYAMGDRFILVDERLRPDAMVVVMVHEMTHYLQYKHGRWDYTQAGRCRAEHEAFDVSNVAARALELPAMLVDWNVMRLQYGCDR